MKQKRNIFKQSLKVDKRNENENEIAQIISNGMINEMQEFLNGLNDLYENIKTMPEDMQEK